MPSPISPDLVPMPHLCVRAGLSTEIECVRSETLRNVRRFATPHIASDSEPAVFPMACDPCSLGLNHTSPCRVGGERKESIRLATETPGESNQFENKNRVNNALLKPPNTVGMKAIKDFGWRRSIQAGEQVMACGAVGGARGYYAI